MKKKYIEPEIQLVELSVTICILQTSLQSSSADIKGGGASSNLAEDERFAECNTNIWGDVFE